MQPKGKTGRADVALNLNGQLYTIEKHHKTASVEERYQARQEQILMQTVMANGKAPYAWMHYAADLRGCRTALPWNYEPPIYR